MHRALEPRNSPALSREGAVEQEAFPSRAWGEWGRSPGWNLALYLGPAVARPWPFRSANWALQRVSSGEPGSESYIPHGTLTLYPPLHQIPEHNCSIQGWSCHDQLESCYSLTFSCNLHFPHKWPSHHNRGEKQRPYIGKYATVFLFLQPISSIYISFKRKLDNCKLLYSLSQAPFKSYVWELRFECKRRNWFPLFSYCMYLIIIWATENPIYLSNLIVICTIL